MKLKDLARRAKPPCPRCPYTLGLVHTLANPCPQCRENGYQMYTRFRAYPEIKGWCIMVAKGGEINDREERISVMDGIR